MEAVDLRQYFPDDGTVYLSKAAGNTSTRYTFKKSPTNGLQNVYTGYMNLNKAGVPFMWRKEYWKNGAWCTATYAILFFGDDLSVTETGDWYAGSPCTPNCVLGYKTAAGVNTGLIWSPAGGICEVPATVEMDVWRQNTPGAPYANSTAKCYSRTGLIEYFPQYTIPYGRDLDGIWSEGYGATYDDVIHIVMYHGTKQPNVPAVRCECPLSTKRKGPFYQSFKDYNSYTIELWLAKGVGIVQEDVPFIEKGWDGMGDCTGDIFQWPGQWASYIDQPL